MATNFYESAVRTMVILAPELILILAAIAMMTLSAFVRRSTRWWCSAAVGAILAALIAFAWVSGRETDLYASAAINDALSYWARLLMLLSGLLILGMAHDEPPDERAGEFFGSLLMMNAGTMLVAAANDIVFLFVGLELVSIPTYLLLYLSRRTPATREAATKYFYLSLFASALLLYGLAFLYGSTGLSNLKAMAYLGTRPLNLPNVHLGLIAVVFVMAGLCFRVAAVPLHFYAPDVYQGSPTVIAAVLSWIPKAVGFLAMIRALTAVFAQASNELVDQAVMLSWIIAVATMILGNFVALLQEDLKRLLAYSSIAHAGYLMVGVTSAFAIGQHGTEFYHGVEGIFFYLVAYALMTLGAFGGIMMLRIAGRPVELVRQLAGLGWTRPWPALALAICLLSLSGLPPLLGFWGKFEIFASALAARSLDDSWTMLVLAILGVLNAAVGAYYYLRIVVLMYLSPAQDEVQVRGGWPLASAVSVCAGLTLVLGLFWGVVAGPARDAAYAASAHPEPPRPGAFTKVADSAATRP